MNADVFFGERRWKVAHENHDCVVGSNYYGVRLEDGKVIVSMCTTDKSVEGVGRIAGEMIKVMKEHHVRSFRFRGGMRIRLTNEQVVYCSHAQFEMELQEKLAHVFDQLPLTALSPAPIHDERDRAQSRPTIYM